MDDIDQVMVGCLARDGRVSCTEMSQHLPINGVAARLRLRRLLETTVRVGALVNTSKIGFPVQTYVGIKARPTSVASVIQKLAEHECTQQVSRVAGAFDVIARVCSRSLQDLQLFIQDNVGSTDGVTDVDTRVCLETLVKFSNPSPKLPLSVVDPPPGVDKVDLRMISFLVEDGRLTARELARKLSISEPTAQRRLRRLIDDRVVTIRGMVKMEELGFPVSAIIGLNVDPGQVKNVTTTLRSHAHITFVAICTGRFNVMVVGIFRSNGELDSVLEEFVHRIAGIRESSVSVSLGHWSTTETWIVPRMSWSDMSQKSEAQAGLTGRTPVVTMPLVARVLGNRVAKRGL